MTTIKQGYTHVYTGTGKGKTTAAIGLAVRALGSGLRVCMFQFMKDYPYGEINILNTMSPQLKLLRFGNDGFVFKKELPSAALLGEMNRGLEEAARTITNGNFDVIILDEILVSVYFNLIKEQDVLDLIKCKPADKELILTGRYCTKSIEQSADLVTNMDEVKHYFQKGVQSRKGIDC